MDSSGTPRSEERTTPKNASLFGLAPNGVYLADLVTKAAGALLPHPFSLTVFIRIPGCRNPDWTQQNRTRGWRSTLCCTCLRVAPTGCYPAFCPMEPGLSSRRKDDRRSSVVLEHIEPMRPSLKRPLSFTLRHPPLAPTTGRNLCIGEGVDRC